MSKALVVGLIALASLACVLLTYCNKTTTTTSSSALETALQEERASREKLIDRLHEANRQMEANRATIKQLSRVSGQLKEAMNEMGVYVRGGSSAGSINNGRKQPQKESSERYELLNDPKYVVDYRRDLCSNKTASVTPVNEGRSASGIGDELPACPPFESGGALNEGSKKLVSVPSESTYQLYASRCSQKGGVMWAHVSPPVHKRFARRLLDILFFGRPEGQRTVSTHSAAEGVESLTWLDWASGCGADMNAYHRIYQDFTANKTRLNAIGIDYTEPAVRWARNNFASMYPSAKRGGEAFSFPTPGRSDGALNSVRFCHADGTKLHWLPKNSFDAITSLGGFIHIPDAVVCSTIGQLISLLKPKTGKMAMCYSYPIAVTRRLLDCPQSCASGEKVVTTHMKLGPLVRAAPDIGFDPIYDQFDADCILWERL